MQNKLLIIAILTLLLLVTACTDTEDIIPTYRFTRQINDIATDPRYNQDNPFIVQRDSYGKVIGNAGVVIFMVTPEEYYVFDLICPYEKKISSLVEIEKNDLHCVCPTCGSKFFIAAEYGGILEGPSKWPLYKYKAEVQNGTLNIWN